MDKIGQPLNYSFGDGFVKFFASIWPVVLDGICNFIYFVVRYILNIVDFLQFFAKKLVGIDYWMSGKPSGLSQITVFKEYLDT